MTDTLTFKPLTLHDKETLQTYSFVAGQRNCNLSFVNLMAWRALFRTEFATTPQALILRYHFDHELRHLVVWKEKSLPAVAHTIDLLSASTAALEQPLILCAVEDELAETLKKCYGSQLSVEPLRDRYDYIYRREALASLAGGLLKAKRNHANKFRSLYPDYQYRPLQADDFAQALALEERWMQETLRERSDEEDLSTLQAEHNAIEYAFAHWDALDLAGGAIFVNNRMVAFTYGAAITPDTWDVCVEKADKDYEGAFAVINQEYCRHLPQQIEWVNREEDMGLPGLRKAKTSYHPELLLSYNALHFFGTEGLYHLERCTPSNSEETCEWMCRQYGFEKSTVDSWMKELHINWPLSVRAVSHGQTIGYLTMSDYRIEEETEAILRDRPALLADLNRFRYTAVFSFIVAPDRKGSRLNYDMLMNIMAELRHYDFVFIPVMHHLKTHQYWQRWGARLFYEDSNCKYYLLPFNPQVLETLRQHGIPTEENQDESKNLSK